MTTAKKASTKQGFKTGEHIVYPSHGVGRIVSIDEQEVAGFKLELFVISFAKDKMTLRVPTTKIASVGMRKLSEAPGRRAWRSRRSRAAPASSARCGRAVPRNMRRRSIPAT